MVHDLKTRVTVNALPFPGGRGLIVHTAGQRQEAP